MIGSFLPYLLMIMMYAGAMQHGIYATAGEKERGTLLSLLATRLPRTQIILGKLLYIFAIGILSALVNLAQHGPLRGAPAGLRGRPRSAGPRPGHRHRPGGPGHPGGPGPHLPADGARWGCSSPTSSCWAGIQARNTLEASTALTPGIFVVVFLGVFSMAPGIEKMGWLPYVPVLNVSLAIRKLFSQQANMVRIPGGAGHDPGPGRP